MRSFMYGSALLALMVGCASARGRSDAEPSEPALTDRTKSGFPTKDALLRVTEVAASRDERRPQQLEVETWTLAGPFPAWASNEPHPANNAWEQMLAAAASAKAGLVIAPLSMHCVAREAGRFFLEHQKYPSPSLQTYIAGRCGAPIVALGVRTLSGDVPETVTEEKLFERWKPQVEEMLAQLGTGTRAAGLWFGREKGRAVVMLATGARKSHLAELAVEPGAKFILRGEILNPADRVRALMNRGRYGVVPCEQVETVRLPRFELRCTGDPADHEAWIELAGFPPGRELGTTVLTVLVSPSGTPAASFERVKYGKDVALDGPDSLVRELIVAVNDVRGQAGMGPLVLDAGQSEVATRVAPAYFAARVGSAPELVADTVVLGLRAGWNVSGLVRFGSFTSAATAEPESLDRIVATALERPYGREVLLNPEVRAIAVGPVWSPESKFAGAVIATYAMFNETPQKELVAKVLARLNEARATAGRPAAELEKVLDTDAQRVAISIVSGELGADEAFQRLLKTASAALDSAVRGWKIEASSLETIEFPPEMLQMTGTRFAISVAHHRPAGEPWARYVVLVVFGVREKPTTASL